MADEETLRDPEEMEPDQDTERPQGGFLSPDQPLPDRTRIRITVAYEGTEFCGWQLQPGLRTVQGELEAVLARVLGRRVFVHGSGRTDSGVHAKAQVAHMDVPSDRASLPWHLVFNASLPRDVRVLDSRPAPPGFHAQFDTVSKTYAYTISQDAIGLPTRRHFVWRTGPLDLSAMAEAAALFVGVHDFAAFRNTGVDVKTTVREVYACGLFPGGEPGEVALRVTASGFLKQMVRNMAGCLVAVGRGKVPPSRVRSLLEEGDRTAAPATAPPRGLCLERVRYAPEDPDDGHQPEPYRPAALRG